MSSKPEEGERTSDEACGSLWEVYLREAEQYDTGLVRSWKEDMDVTLVFSGLYSAVLTAFIIQSYQNLQQDQTQLSVTFLAHISGQLASLSSVENVPLTLNQEFSPSSSAIACNILWFLSLILALSCSLLATFVQQWTRHFLHRTTILRTPAARARLISFLYFGLKNFKMHAIVDVIPSLLHLSLFAFFGGLVAFLHPINPALQWLVIGSFCLLAAIYMFFTLIPVINLSSPYQTPLSPIVWRTWQSFWWSAEKFLNLRLLYSRSRDSDMLPTASQRQYNLTYAMINASHHGRREREARSMAWTLRSLNNITEFLPFVEAIPDVIYGVHGILHVENFHLLKPILETSDPDVDIISRLFSLYINTRDYWMKDEDRNRSAAAFPDAIWALAFTLNQLPQAFDLRKTGRCSWFSWEQVHLLEKYKQDVGLEWMTPIIYLVKSNIILCRELNLHSRNPYTEVNSISRDYASLDDSEEQGRLLTKYLRELADSLPKQVWMSTATFYAMKGHEHAKKLDFSPMYEALSKRLADVAEETQNASQEEEEEEEEEDSDQWEDSIGDEVGYSLIQLCRKDHVPAISRYLNKRATIKEKYPMLLLWAPSCERENDHIPPYAPFLRAVAAHRVYSESCVKALLDILWQFNKHPDKDENLLTSTSSLRLNPRWWSDFEPTWLDILVQVESLDDNSVHSYHRSLAIMIKAAVLKKIDPSKAGEKHDDLNFFEFVDEISSVARVAGQPDWMTVRSAFVALVTQQLEELDEDGTDSFEQVKDTLKFLDCGSLIGAVYDIHPEITRRLAVQTRRCCEVWKQNPTSKEMLAILKMVWTLWERSDRVWIVDGGHWLRPDLPIRIVPDAVADILRAADILLNSYPALDATDDKKEDEEEKSTDNSLQEYMARVKAIRGLWATSVTPGITSGENLFH